MCLPFCCDRDDHGSPSHGGTGVTTTHDPHGDGKTDEPVVLSSTTGNGKESNNGNGAGENKKREGFKNGGNTDSPPTPPLQQSPEGWAEHQTGPSTPSGQAPDEHRYKQIITPSPTPAVKASKHTDPSIIEPPENGDRLFKSTTPATKGPKQSEHVAATGPRPHHQEPVGALQPKDKATGTMTTPPSPQIASRSREDYYPTAPAANNGLGDHDQDGGHAYGGKGDRRTPGKPRR